MQEVSTRCKRRQWEIETGLPKKSLVSWKLIRVEETLWLLKTQKIIVLFLQFPVADRFTEFYTGGSHTASAQYLFLGLHGKNALVPWIWTAFVFNIIAIVLFLSPWVLRHTPILIIACSLAFIGAWIEKGMGLIVPGFIPSTLHEVVEYTPSLTEWKVSAGIWAFGILVLTILLKIAIAVFSRGPVMPRESELGEST